METLAALGQGFALALDPVEYFSRPCELASVS
jgi:hypothetical protein